LVISNLAVRQRSGAEQTQKIAAGTGYRSIAPLQSRYPDLYRPVIDTKARVV